jgi:hypothetical protein
MLPFVTMAQEIGMADKFREEGKIFVVISIIGVILIGLLIYLIFLDRKIARLEKEKKKE